MVIFILLFEDCINIMYFHSCFLCVNFVSFYILLAEFATCVYVYLYYFYFVLILVHAHNGFVCMHMNLVI